MISSKLKVNTNRLEVCQEFIYILNISGIRIAESYGFMTVSRFGYTLTNSSMLISVTFSPDKTTMALSRSSKPKISTA